MTSVRVSAQISISRCHSRLERANRDASRAKMAPTRPRDTSATQSLEILAVGRLRSRPSEILVEDPDSLRRPHHLDGPVPQGVLPLRTLVMMAHLPHRRLPDIDVGRPLEVVALYFRHRQHRPRSVPDRWGTQRRLRGAQRPRARTRSSTAACSRPAGRRSGRRRAQRSPWALSRSAPGVAAAPGPFCVRTARPCRRSRACCRRRRLRRGSGSGG